MNRKYFTVTVELEHPDSSENPPLIDHIFNEYLIGCYPLEFKNGIRIINIGWNNTPHERDAYEEALIDNGIDPREAIEEWKKNND